jgi:hypothetical protein
MAGTAEPGLHCAVHQEDSSGDDDTVATRSRLACELLTYCRTYLQLILRAVNFPYCDMQPKNYQMSAL